MSYLSRWSRYSILSSFGLYKSTFPSLSNNSTQVSVPSSMWAKYLISWMAPYCAAIFVWSFIHQQFYLTIFTCSLCWLHPLEQEYWGAYCKSLPSLLWVGCQGQQQQQWEGRPAYKAKQQDDNVIAKTTMTTMEWYCDITISHQRGQQWRTRNWLWWASVGAGWWGGGRQYAQGWKACLVNRCQLCRALMNAWQRSRKMMTHNNLNDDSGYDKSNKLWVLKYCIIIYFCVQ